MSYILYIDIQYVLELKALSDLTSFDIGTEIDI